jgi:hypothetical protein
MLPKKSLQHFSVCVVLHHSTNLLLLLLYSLVLFEESLPIQLMFTHGSSETPLPPHSTLLGDNCNNFKHTSYTYQ